MANSDSDSDDDMFGGLSNMDLKNVEEAEENTNEGSKDVDVDRLTLEGPLARIFKYSNYSQEESPHEESTSSEVEVKDVDAEDSANRDLSILVEWIEKCGGYVHPKLTMAPFPDSGVGGCVANNNGVGLNENELLIRVPAKCIIFSDDASIEGLKVVPSTMASMDLKQIVLALALIEEMRKGDSSEFVPYVKTLPNSLRSFPIMWTPTELELLKTLSPETHSQVVSQAKALRSEYDHIIACFSSGDVSRDIGITFSEYMHAKLLVCSRCFGIGSKGDVALLPMIDMLNHSLTPHVALGRHQSDHPNSTTDQKSLPATPSIDDDDNSFELRMVRCCAENEEIFSTYDKQGTRTAASWLLNYGFVPLKLTHDDEVELTSDKSISIQVAGAEEGGSVSAAVEALRKCGPHTHGAIRLVLNR